MLRNLARKLRLNEGLYIVRRQARAQRDKLFARVTHDMLVSAFRGLGLESGAVVCVHASLSRLGHVVGGGRTVIEALIEVVKTEGCILMPSFPMSGSMAHYLEQGRVFDVGQTPSTSGSISEVFRHWPGVQRSLHPTNPLTAWGNRASRFLRDHEKSLTPYGFETPYGRLADEDRSYILMLETHIHSLLHHLQERVEFPNLFLPEEREVFLLDHSGQKRSMRTRVMRPRIPYFVAIPSSSGPEPDWAILHDFALMFPERRQSKVRQLGYRFDGYQRLYQRRSQLVQAQALTSTHLGSGEIGLLHVKTFLAQVEPELRHLIDRYRSYYDPSSIAALDLPYG